MRLQIRRQTPSLANAPSGSGAAFAGLLAELCGSLQHEISTTAHLGDEAAAAGNQDLGRIEPVESTHVRDEGKTTKRMQHSSMRMTARGLQLPQHGLRGVKGSGMHLCCVSTPQTRICRSYTAASAFDNAAMTGLLYQEGVIFASTFTHCVQFQYSSFDLLTRW